MDVDRPKEKVRRRKEGTGSTSCNGEKGVHKNQQISKSAIRQGIRTWPKRVQSPNPSGPHKENPGPAASPGKMHKNDEKLAKNRANVDII